MTISTFNYFNFLKNTVFRNRSSKEKYDSHFRLLYFPQKCDIKQQVTQENVQFPLSATQESVQFPHSITSFFTKMLCKVIWLARKKYLYDLEFRLLYFSQRCDKTLYIESNSSRESTINTFGLFIFPVNNVSKLICM